MRWKFLRAFVQGDEIETAAGRALLEERYAALRRQVPVIYLLVVVNLGGLQATTSGRLVIGLNLPTLFTAFAILRTVQWFRTNEEVPHAVMRRRMRRSCWVAAALCFAVSVWCLHLLETAEAGTHMAIVLFGGLTAIGVAYGLSAVPWAACAPLMVLAVPLIAVSLMSPNPKYVGASLSLAVVCLLVLRLLSIQDAQFTALVRSRSTISRERRLSEQARQEALVAATTDFLTGLPNRRAFVAALEAAVDEDSGVESFAIAVIDMDGFKVINDTLGHLYGDEVLKTVADRLVRGAGSSTLVARLGGDEFGLLFPGVSSPAEALLQGQRIIAEVNQPAIIFGRQVLIRGSCGLGVSKRGQDRTPSRAMTDADIALYDAKSQPSAPIAVFHPQMEAPRRRRAQIEHALQMPDVHENIRLVFQPIIDLVSGKIVANEALARWHDDELGEIPPSEFVPIAEQLDVIGNIGEHLMVRSLAEAAHWAESVRLSFNLSAVQLCSESLAETVLAKLAAANLGPNRLQVEVTETALLVDFDRARRTLEKLRQAGVMIVLDDFGAGYASIGYLREIQFDRIKIDGALVTAAIQSSDAERLLGAVVGLCRALGVTTVAEHVENEQQLSMLLKLGCTFGQGFWLQPPMSPEQAREQSCLAGSARALTTIRSRRSAA